MVRTKTNAVRPSRRGTPAPPRYQTRQWVRSQRLIRRSNPIDPIPKGRVVTVQEQALIHLRQVHLELARLAWEFECDVIHYPTLQEIIDEYQLTEYIQTEAEDYSDLPELIEDSEIIDMMYSSDDE